MMLRIGVCGMMLRIGVCGMMLRIGVCGITDADASAGLPEDSRT
jgi:hypothetical protein